MRPFSGQAWQRVLVALAAAALVATACAPSGAPSGQQAPADQPQPGGRLIWGAFADIKTMQPMLVNDVPSREVTNQIYAGLYFADPKTGELRPNLGKWSASSDGKTYTWEIDAKANWSDGKPITGEDYLATVKATARSKKTVRKTNLQDIEGFKDYQDGKATSISGIKIDSANPKKFAVTFTRVFCPALVNAFGPSTAPIPAHIFGKYTVDSDAAKNIDDAPENLAPTVASGAFKFKEWRKGDQVILVRNESYFKGPPLLDEFVWKVVADSTVLAAQLKTGELNYGTVEPKDLEDIERQENLKVFKYQALSYTYIGWNTQSKSASALQDKRVRQALAYGLDMDAVVKTILFGQGTKMVSHHPPASWAFPKTGMNDYKLDQAKARQLIESAGFTKGADGFYAKDGKALAFSIVANSGNKVRETLLQVATEQYKQIGVKVNPKLESFETMVDKLTTGNQEIEAWIIGWSLGLEPDPYGIWAKEQIPDPAAKKTGFNFGGYFNPDEEKAMVEARTPSSGDCAQAARQKQYETFNKVLNEDQPYNFGFSPNTLLATVKNLQGPDPGTFSEYWNIEKWWFKK